MPYQLGGGSPTLGSNPPAPATLPTKARKDPLTHVHANLLVDHARSAEALLLVEHDNAGNHNALEVARELATVTFAAGAYALNYSTIRGFFTAVNKIAVGQARITVNAAALKTGKLGDDACFALTPTGNGLETKPQILCWKVVDDTHVDVFIWQLSSALGAGNAWALTDDGFTIAMYALPIATNVSRFSSDTSAKPHVKGSNLSALSTDWNSLVQLQGDVRGAFLLAHASAGTHLTQEVAKLQAHVTYDGFGPTLADNIGFNTVTRPGAGKYVLAFDARSSASYEAFTEADYPRTNAGVGNERYILGVPKSQWTTTQVEVFIFKYDPLADTWNYADTDFYLAIHAPG